MTSSGYSRHDLELSGFFSIISPKSYIEDPQNSGYDLGKFNFGDWSSLNADFLVKGAVTVSGGQVSVEALMFDVAQQRRMFGTRFSGGPGDVEEMARRFADSVLKAVTGIQGPFDTRIAFVSTRGGRFKEIYLASPDGGGLFRVTDNPTINLFPKFAHSAASVLYLSYKTGAPALYLFDVAGRTEIRIGSPHGNVIGGALSPDGSRIVAAVENGGHTNLFLLERSGEEIRQLTEGQRDQRQSGILGRRPTARLYLGPLGHAADLRDEPRRRPGAPRHVPGRLQHLAVVLARRQMDRLSEPLGRV